MNAGSLAILTLMTLAQASREAALRPREVAAGVHVVSFSDQLGSANAGWVVLDDRVVLIGAPDPSVVPELLDAVKSSTGKPAREAILTQGTDGELRAACRLAAEGVRILGAAGTGERLRAAGLSAEAHVGEIAEARSLKAAGRELNLIPLGSAASPCGLAVHLQPEAVLFTGGACVNGPRVQLPGSNTARWARLLTTLRELQPRVVIPGRGSEGGPEILERHERFLLEIRRQVGHLVAQRWPFEAVRKAVRIEPEWLVWMPYDTPTPDDIGHVYAELTVPRSPFLADPFESSERASRALAIIGDSPHEPGHIEAGLRPVLSAAGVAVRFAVDPRALSAENLKEVQLLVLLRDGNSWPDGPDSPSSGWMTPEQERAVVDFVESGGGFIALHNSTGLYPKDGPYLRLLGGTYEGHGPLERFRVEVSDPDHPIASGVSAYEVADEQHTPRPDLASVHVILRSRSAGGITAAAGWVREAGHGRVVYLANGHTRDALGNPMFSRLIQNATRWCLAGKK